MRKPAGLMAAVAVVLGLMGGFARADVLQTVVWAPDDNRDGFGTGTLGGTTVTYTTVAGAGDAGSTIPASAWTSSPATNDAVGDGATDPSGGLFGTTGQGQLSTIEFEDSIVDPILLVNFADPGTSIDLSGLNFEQLDANNAALASGVYTFAGAANTSSDGFAVRLLGTFGPAAPISFLYNASPTGGFASVAFTVGRLVPEPGSIALVGIGLAGMLVVAGRRHRAGRVA
jgi:hypothetical protein